VGLIAAGPVWAAKKATETAEAPPPPSNSLQGGKSPIKVFILAGQSNMEGQGKIEGDKPGTMETLVKNPASAARYKLLVDKAGKWIVRDDVWCVFTNRGGLTVGGYASKGSIGPELGFGWAVGDYLDNQVLLIKCAWGGKSLGKDFRPPSSGGEAGDYYKKMIASVKEQLANLKTDFSRYDGKGYEIVGFGWFQGWQDGCTGSLSAEYEKNLANFIRDVRKDFGVPKMPFVIGGSGFNGWDLKVDRRLQVIKAQQAVAQQAEFKDTVRYVETRDFFRDPALSPGKQGYHFNGNAETYWLVGSGMGKAMVELLGGPKAPLNPTGPSK
jgi:alpha-galactosidase